MPLGTNEATNYLANNNDLLIHYRDNIAGKPEEALYGGNVLRFASAHYDQYGKAEIERGARSANSLAPFVPIGDTGGDDAGFVPPGQPYVTTTDPDVERFIDEDGVITYIRGGPGGGGTTGGGTTGGGTTGGGTTGGGTTGGTGGIMSGPVDLAPVTNLIGTPGAGQTGPQATLMGQTAGLATGQQGIRDIVTPLGEQVTGIRDIVTPLGEQVTGIGTQIGTADTDAGQTDLFAGQAGLQSGQQAMQATQAGLEAGQLGLGQQIGTAAVTNEQDEVIQQPTGLYAGQAGLMSGQTGLTQDISGLGRNLSGIGDQLSGDLSGLGSQLGAFRTAAEQYQRGATTQRGDIQGTQRAGQAALTAQVQGVGQQANRAAEAIAQQRQQQPAVQQQAAQFARSAPRATTSNQQVGPMGPMATDPRDAIMRQLMANRTGLMNRGPV